MAEMGWTLHEIEMKVDVKWDDMRVEVTRHK